MFVPEALLFWCDDVRVGHDGEPDDMAGVTLLQLWVDVLQRLQQARTLLTAAQAHPHYRATLQHLTPEHLDEMTWWDDKASQLERTVPAWIEAKYRRTGLPVPTPTVPTTSDVPPRQLSSIMKSWWNAVVDVREQFHRAMYLEDELRFHSTVRSG